VTPAALLARLDAERRALRRDGDEIDILPHLTRLRPADGAYHCVTASALTAQTADAVIEAQIAHYRGLNAAFEWKAYSHDPPPDLLTRLARHGFAIGPREAVLILDLQSPPPWLRAPAPCDIVRVQTPAHLSLFRAAAEAIFQKDYALTTHQLEQSLRTGSTHHLAYLALVNDTAAAIGRLYTHPASHFGGLYGGGTLPAHRGRGLYRALVAARARDAIELGARHLLVDALPTSQPILQRLGFQHVADTWPCEWTPARPPEQATTPPTRRGKRSAAPDDTPSRASIRIPRRARDADVVFP
jgi:GNAT superfamily N-acetyltransferase